MIVLIQECGTFEDDGMDYSSIDTNIPEVPDKPPVADINQPSEDNPASESVQPVTGLSSAASTVQTRVCPGHERGMPVESTVMALDLKEECKLFCALLWYRPKTKINYMCPRQRPCHFQPPLG